MANDEMKKEYDFSQAVRGKFFHPNLRLRLPVYLDDEALAFVQRLARKKKTDVSSVVNQLILSETGKSKSRTHPCPIREASKTVKLIARKTGKPKGKTHPVVPRHAV